MNFDSSLCSLNDKCIKIVFGLEWLCISYLRNIHLANHVFTWLDVFAGLGEKYATSLAT